MALSGEDYIELLPAQWRSIGDGGIQIEYRTYNCSELAPYRRLSSGIAAKGGRWEVHYDPYEVTRIWVRNHHHGGWITVPWTHLSMVTQPFADFTWRHARRIASQRGVDDTNETAIAVVLAALLRRAEQGPGSERALARTTAAAELRGQVPLALPPTAVTESDQDQDCAQAEELTATVVGFGLFDPFADDSREHR